LVGTLVLAIANTSFGQESGVEIQESIYGYGTDVVPGNFGVISDPNFGQIQGLTDSEIADLFGEVSASNIISLGVNNKHEEAAILGYELRVDFSVFSVENGVDQWLEDFTLETSYNPDDELSKDQYRSARKVDGQRQLNVVINGIEQNILDGVDNFVSLDALPANAYVQAHFVGERAYAFDFVAIPNYQDDDNDPNNIQHQFLNGLDDEDVSDNNLNGFPEPSNTDVRITWDHIDGAEFYELEWTYINDYSAAYDANLNPTNIPFTNQDFRRNNSRIITNFLHYDIPLTFDKGYVIYRVRGVGKAGLSSSPYDYLTPGRWSSDWISSPQSVADWPNKIHITESHENQLNWQLVTTFAEDGKKKEVISYYDGLNRNRQVVTRINSEKEAVAAETIYDYHGRAAINILPAPTSSSSLDFYENLNRNMSNEAYSAIDFDVDQPNICGLIPASPMSDAKGTNYYYSGSEFFGDERSDYIPNSNGYAFSQVIYTPDNTGRISVQGGVGEHHQVNGRNTRYFYNTAEQYELDRLFGYEVGYSSRYKKNIVVDPNNQVSVSYVDAHGRTIATALAGSSPENVYQLENLNPMSSVSVDLIESAVWNEELVSSSYLTTVTPISPGQNNGFDYTISDLAAFTNECMDDGTSFNMVFDLEYRFTDACGEPLSELLIDESLSVFGGNPILESNFGDYNEGAGFDQVGNYNSFDAQLNPSSSFGYSHSAQSNQLDIQNYYLSRGLILNEEAMNNYALHYAEMAIENCLAADIVQVESNLNAQAAIDGQCDPCEGCQLAVASGELTQAECDEICAEGQQDECSYYRLQMLYDVSPDGQYGVNDSQGSNLFEGLPFSQSHNDYTPYYPLLDGEGLFSLVELTPLGDNEFSPDIIFTDPYINVLEYSEIGLDVSWADVNWEIHNRLSSSYHIVKLENVYYTLPRNLQNLDDFMGEWEDSWAESLIELHPEYCFLESCEGMRDYESIGYQDVELSKSVFGYEEFLSGLEENHPLFTCSCPAGGQYQDLAQRISDVDYAYSDPLLQVMNDFQLTVFQSELLNYQGIGLDIYETAASAADCSAWYGNDVQNCVSEFDSFEEWQVFLGLYFAKRQEFIQTLMTNSPLCGAVPEGKNEVFGNEVFFDDNEEDSLSVDSTPDEVWNEVNYQTYVQTGICPVTNSLFNFLKYLSDPEFIQGEESTTNLLHSQNQPLLEVSAFSYMLYYHITGGTFDNPYLHPTYSVNDLGNSLEVVINNGGNPEIITITGVPVDLNDLNDLRFVEFNVIHTDQFEILAEYGPFQQVILTGSLSSFDLNNCQEWVNDDFPIFDSPDNIPNEEIGEFYESYSQECIFLNQNAHDLFSIMQLMSIDLQDGGNLLNATSVLSSTETLPRRNIDEVDVFVSQGFTHFEYSWPNSNINNEPIFAGTCTELFENTLFFLNEDPDHLLFPLEVIDYNQIGNSYYLTLLSVSNLDGNLYEVTGEIILSPCESFYDLYDCEPEIYTPQIDCQFLNLPLASCNVAYAYYLWHLNWLDGYDQGQTNQELLGINLGDNFYQFNEIGSDIAVDPNEDYAAPYQFLTLEEFCDLGLAPYVSYYIEYLERLQDVNGLNHQLLSISDPLYVSIEEFAAGDYQLYTSSSLINEHGIGDYIAYLSIFNDELPEISGSEIEDWIPAYEIFYENPYLIRLQDFVSGGFSQDRILEYYNYVNSDPSELLTIFEYFESADLEGELPTFCVTFPSQIPDADEIFVEDDCAEFAESVAEENLAIYISTLKDELVDDFKAQYKAHALTLQESLIHARADQEYHHTLYYYDLAGNLTRTTPPGGVVQNSTELDRDNAPLENVTEHTLNTYYKYNTLNQLIWQKTPDGGETNFWYDELGRLICSQNAEQAPDNNYSYTLYDDLGRIQEVGEFLSNFNMDELLLASHKVESSDEFKSTVLIQLNTNQVVRTYYDDYALAVNFNSNEESTTRNRVTSVTYSEVGTGNLDQNIDFATHYNYDIHGNVRELVQEIRGLEELEQSQKHIEYTYDLVSGNVHEVVYQREEVDQFCHKYTYDGDNRITDVHTSDNLWFWERDAKYYYYRHGPLERSEIGDDVVQGVDYAYTLHGWLKGVNSNLLNTQNDMGKDGHEYSTHKFSAKDEFGFSLGYYYDDYSARGEDEYYTNWLIEKNEHSLFTENTLHNGNISHMVTSIGAFLDNGDQPLLMGYEYDQLNRIKSSRKYVQTQADANIWNPGAIDDFATSYLYDANGNILELKRNGYLSADGGLAMDNLSYEYLNGNNQLTSVMDNEIDAMIDDEDFKYASALKNQEYTYTYDEIGNLISDSGEGIVNIDWTVRGKVSKVEKTIGPDLEFRYDAMGNRVVKITKTADQSTWSYTYYVRDAQGNVMSVYEKNIRQIEGTNNYEETLDQAEIHIYGSSRVGLERKMMEVAKRSFEATLNSIGELIMGPDEPVLTSASLDEENLISTKGDKAYEFSNHLGNVLVTLNDKLIRTEDGNSVSYKASVLTAQNYYPFGMVMPGNSDCGSVISLETEVEVDRIHTQFETDGDTENWTDCSSGTIITAQDGLLKMDGFVGSGDLTAFLSIFGNTEGEYFEHTCSAIPLTSADSQLEPGEVSHIRLDIEALEIDPLFEFSIQLLNRTGGVVQATQTLEHTLNEGINEFEVVPDPSIFGDLTVNEVQIIVGFEIGNGVDGITSSDLTAFLTAFGSVEYYVSMEEAKIWSSSNTVIELTCPSGPYNSGDYRYGFNGHEIDMEMFEGYVSWGDYGYDARLGRRYCTDPMEFKYSFLSPYSVVNNNPIIFDDPDGKDWIITTTTDISGNTTIHITLTAAVLNSSSQKVDMNKFIAAVKQQIEESYSLTETETVPGGLIEIQSGLDRSSQLVTTYKQVTTTVEIDVQLREITSPEQLADDEHLMEIADDNQLTDANDAAEGKKVLGYAHFGGKYLRINVDIVKDVISGKEMKTIPHEFGHTANLYHPNLGWGLLWNSEQYMKDGTHNQNLMYQTSYQNNILNDFSKGNKLLLSQIKIMLREYQDGNLNEENIESSRIIPPKELIEKFSSGSGYTGQFTCFVKGTKILMANGNSKNIEDIVVGDIIKAVDTLTMLITQDTVYRIPERVKKYRKIQLNTDDDVLLEFSPAHPIWVKGKGWCVYNTQEALKELNFSVQKLEKGDVIYYYCKGQLAEKTVVNLIETSEFVDMYNVEHVKTFNTFFANGILVHNKLN